MLDIKKAIQKNNFIQVKKLIQRGIDLNLKIQNDENDHEELLIFYAIGKKCSFDIIKLMLENGVDLYTTNYEGVSILDEAIIHSNMDLIKYLVQERSFDVNMTKRDSGFTPLIQASCYGNIEIVKYLLENGANIEQRDRYNLTAIDYARKLGQKKMLEFLENL